MTKAYLTVAERDAARDAASALTNCEVLTEAETSHLLHVHQLTLTIWRRKGKGPPYVDGGDVKMIRYLRADVMAWLASQRKLAPAESDGLNMMRKRAKAGTAEKIEFDTARCGIDGVSNDDVAEGVHAERKSAARGGRSARNK